MTSINYLTMTLDLYICKCVLLLYLMTFTFKFFNIFNSIKDTINLILIYFLNFLPNDVFRLGMFLDLES